jgi:multiple sugar transport system substrate-binding protein
MKFSQKQIIIVGAVGLVVVLIFGLIYFNLRGGPGGSSSFTIKFWGTDSKDMVEPAITSYKAAHPLGSVEYTQVDPGEYQKKLLNALASGVGPDLFYLNNRELPKQKSRLIALNPALFPNMSISRFRDELFPAAVVQDFTFETQIYAVPLYFDTMALLYHRDLFDQAGIVAPPKTWDEFQAVVGKIRAVNSQGQIVRAAAAIGSTEKTVDAGVDLLHLLMLQNGTKMVADDLRSATFASGDTSERDAGNSAFNFYLQFANAGSPYYTWSDNQPNSLDSFAAGKTAMIFNYRSALDAIKKKSPFLNIGVAPMPQAAGDAPAVNYGRYYGLAVSKQSQVQYQAWDFALYLTTNIDNEKLYLGATGRPPALRPLIQEALASPNMEIFARQTLTARSWYQADDAEVERIFNEAIQNVLNGQKNSEAALRQAQDQVSQLMGKN